MAATSLGIVLGAAIPWEEIRDITIQDIAATENILDLSFTHDERTAMVDGLEDFREAYQAMRGYSIENAIFPAMQFDPLPIGWQPNNDQQPIAWEYPITQRPSSDEMLAFLSVPELASLIRTKQVTAVELTSVYINRLKTYGDTLLCVITLLENEALIAAKQADRDIAAGNYRGPLHGIPYGVKDLLALPGTKTTWGAMPYKDQEIDMEATVIKNLNEAGAILVAKLTLGALAMGDIWYGGVTKNPWNLEQGSSGSSAGSASATVAGLVGFSIGTETLGSIVSPSSRCGASGLRPTYGRVSRHGAMALSWSMDKIGPICRSAEGAAMVFDAIQGLDPLDPTLIDADFNYSAHVELSELRIGYLDRYFQEDHRGKENDLAVLETLRGLGANLQAVSFETDIPVSALRLILTAESAAAFDELTRSNQDSLLVNQAFWAWPNTFRKNRFVPAVEYLQANRLRRILAQEVHQWFQQYDVIVAPSFGGPQLLITNLTGQPCVVVPNGFDDSGSPTSISFLGNLFDEAMPLAVAKAFQAATEFEDKHPQLPNTR